MTASRKFLGSGFAFPLRVTPQGGIDRAAEEPLVQQAMWVILATAKGEMQANPGFGCGIHDLVFVNNTPPNRAQIAHQVRDALLSWEHRIDVIDVRVDAGDEPNQLMIGIDYRLKTTHAYGNLVYPFYLSDTEGSANAA
jgi:phage baseplate assembly protein W